jgi:pyruvate,water dikinase
MKDIKRLDDFNPEHDITSGGKGKSLAVLLNKSINVPNGFVVLSSAFDKFISDSKLEKEIELVLQKVDKNLMHTVEHASEQIQALILNTKFPEYLESEILEEYKRMNLNLVAVRSSATAEDGLEHAWAGQLDSYLNTDVNNLVLNVQKCWASLFTPRAIFYRFQKDLHVNAISVAVVIQEMVQSEVSGIAFSVHPITQDTNELIIEAGYGLGEAIVSGKVTSDSYTVTKNNYEVIDKYISKQDKKLVLSPEFKKNEWMNILMSEAESQKLTEEQIKELSDLIVKIEGLYNKPQDIEWAYANGKFYITQSRPITTLQ